MAVERVRRIASQAGRRLVHAAADLARRVGLLSHRPEHWTTERWAEAYGSGSLDFYGNLDELPRYSVILGYIGWSAEVVGRSPRVLDVGCGTGLLRERLAEDAFAEFVGVDVSATAIDEAEARAHPRSRFLLGDVTSMDLGHFDTIVVNEVLYYLDDPASFLTHLQALLHPDGLLVVSMWRHPGDRSLWRTVDAVTPIIDRVEIRNRANPMNPRGWVVAASVGSGAVRPRPPRRGRVWLRRGW